MNKENLDSALTAFLKLICYLENSELIKPFKNKNAGNEDIHDLLYIPIKRLSEIYKDIEKGAAHLNEKYDDIQKWANAIWYAIDCNSHTRNSISTKAITIDKNTKDTLLSFLNRPLNTQLDIDNIHDIAEDIYILLNNNHD